MLKNAGLSRVANLVLLTEHTRDIILMLFENENAWRMILGGTRTQQRSTKVAECLCLCCNIASSVASTVGIRFSRSRSLGLRARGARGLALLGLGLHVRGGSLLWFHLCLLLRSFILSCPRGCNGLLQALCLQAPNVVE